MQIRELKNFIDKSDVHEINLRDYIVVLKKRQKIAFTFLGIAVLLAIIVTFSMTPLYTASSQVLIERNMGDDSIEKNYSYRAYDPQFLDTQFKIITSFNVVKRAVEQLQLDTKYRYFFLK